MLHKYTSWYTFVEGGESAVSAPGGTSRQRALRQPGGPLAGAAAVFALAGALHQGQAGQLVSRIPGTAGSGAAQTTCTNCTAGCSFNAAFLHQPFSPCRGRRGRVCTPRCCSTAHRQWSWHLWQQQGSKQECSVRLHTDKQDSVGWRGQGCGCGGGGCRAHLCHGTSRTLALWCRDSTGTALAWTAAGGIRRLMQPGRASE